MGKSYYYMEGKLIETIKHKKAKPIKQYCLTCKKTTEFRLFGVSSIDGDLRICNQCEQFENETKKKIRV